MIYITTNPGVDLHILLEEIRTTISPATPMCVGNDDGSVFIETDVTLDESQEAALLSAVASHDAEPLSALIPKLLRMAGAHYEKCRDLGFIYDGKAFTGSLNSITQLNTGRQVTATESYPIYIPTKSGVKYSVANATALQGLFDSMKTHTRTCLENFANASDAIVTATDKASAQAAYDAYVSIGE